MSETAGQLTQIALLVWVITFLLLFFTIYSLTPKFVQSLGPDRMRTGKPCTRTAVIASALSALLLTGIIILTYMVILR